MSDCLHVITAAATAESAQGEFVQRRDGAPQTESYWHPTGWLDRRGILLRGSPRPSPTGLSLSVNLPTVC